MVELGTALRSMAAEVEASPEADGGDLWARGRARVRRRRAIGAVVGALVVAVVGIGSFLVPEPVVVMPAGAVHPPGYPDQVYRPSRWLAGTDDKGPLGQLAVIAPAEHGSEIAMFGVSATTGEYRFLDLPGWVVGSRVSLAPDGRHVAYWTTGHTTSAPYPDPVLAGGGRAQAIAGMAIYDTVTGAVQRTRIPTEHGMSDEDLFWADSRTVYFGDWQLENRHGASRSQFLSVVVGDSTATTVSDSEGSLIGASRTSDGKLLTASVDGLTWHTTGPSVPDAGSSTTFRLPRKLPEKHSTGEDATYTYVSRAADTVVVEVNDTPSLADTLMTGSIRAGEVTDLRLVGDRFQNVRVLGWHDDRTLLAYGRTRTQDAVLAAVDVEDGKVTTLSRMSEQGWGDQLVPALDVLRGDVVAGREPPTPMDPRVRNAWFAAGGLVVVGTVLVLVRRRRRG